MLYLKTVVLKVFTYLTDFIVLCLKWNLYQFLFCVLLLHSNKCRWHILYLPKRWFIWISIKSLTNYINKKKFTYEFAGNELAFLDIKMKLTTEKIIKNVHKKNDTNFILNLSATTPNKWIKIFNTTIFKQSKNCYPDTKNYWLVRSKELFNNVKVFV